MKYDSTLYVTHHLIGDCGNVTEYFTSNSRHGYVFSMCPTFMDEPTRLTVYEDGKKIRTWDYRWYAGGNIVLKYVFIYLYYLHARLFRVRRNTEVVTFHPLFCVGHSMLRLLRGGKTVFWVFDFFDSYDGLYGVYNRLADFYVRHLPRVYFLGGPMRATYERRVGRRPDAVWETLVLGMKQRSTVGRKPETGVLGFIGNLKASQGVEEVMDALAVDHDLRLEIIGVGVLLEPLKQHAVKAGVSDRVQFLAPVFGDENLSRATAHWEAGMALYKPTVFTPYADPGKIKLYMELGVPVMTTDATPFHAEITESGAGIVTEMTPKAIIAGLRDIRASREKYAAGIKAMTARYEFVSMYDDKFSYLRKAAI